MSLKVNPYKFKNYQYFLTDKIITNQAYCSKCKKIVTSILNGKTLFCSCLNIGVNGGKKQVIHQWLDKEFYHNRTIVLVKGD